MNHIIQLYAQEIVTALTAIAVILMGANIGQAITAIVRKHDIADLDEANRSIVAELTEERVKREQAEVLNERMGDEQIEHLLNMKKLRQQLYDAEAERDEARAEAMQFAADLNTLQAERAHLYRRNAKGHFEAVVPQKPKPHTLKHGMTVKNPSAYQAKRIFAEAKRAGMDWDTLENMAAVDPTADIIFWPYEWNGEKKDCVINRPESYPPVSYISAREFIRRIKGEIE
jgi:hypothetical protein